VNKENFEEMHQYLLDGKITLTTYRMLVETFERMHELKKEHSKLEQSIIEELEKMELGEFNHYYFNNTH
jgi:predicted DNA-binding protein